MIKRVQSGASCVIVFSILATILAQGLFLRSAHSALIDRIVATVNNEVILQSDFDKFQRTFKLRREIDPILGFDKSMGYSPSRAKIQEFLIQERLITQTFRATEADIDQEIQAVMRNANVSRREELDQFLRREGFSPKEYEELIAVAVSKRALIDREIRSRVNISDDDVRNDFYNKALKNSSIPLEYKIQLIIVDVAQHDSPQVAQNIAERALRAINQGEAFEDVIRYSDDPSKENLGIIDDYLSSDQLVEPIRSAVKGLQIGSHSKVLKNDRSYIIVKLLDARSMESKQFVEAKERIRQELAEVEYEKQLYLWADRARNDAYVKVNE